ncbi:MAG: ogr/Delta-like zinc finger family protein [Pseudomonadota bacterium]
MKPDDSTADKERFKCPHCGTHLATRSSRAVSPIYKEKSLYCTNANCGATFKSESSLTAQISPSACPNPRVVLPSIAPRRRMIPVAVAANDTTPAACAASNIGCSGPEVPRAANDDHGPAVALG